MCHFCLYILNYFLHFIKYFSIDHTRWIDVCPTDENLLATCGHDMDIKIYDRRESKIVRTFYDIHFGKICSNPFNTTNFIYQIGSTVSDGTQAEICWLQLLRIKLPKSLILRQEESFIQASLQMEVIQFIQNLYTKSHLSFLITRPCQFDLFYLTKKESTTNSGRGNRKTTYKLEIFKGIQIIYIYKQNANNKLVERCSLSIKHNIPFSIQQSTLIKNK